MVKQKRTEIINITLTEAEKKAILKASKTRGLSVASVVRSSALKEINFGGDF